MDVNARLDPDEWPVTVRGQEISPGRLGRELHQAGVVRAVVLPGAQRIAESYLRPDSTVARMSVGRPFLAFARINDPRDPSGQASAQFRNFRSSRANHHADPGDIKQHTHDGHFRGFSLAPAVDEFPDDKTLAMLEDVGLPIFVGGGQAFEPNAIAQSLLERSPVVLSGFGGFPPDRGLMDEAIGLLDDHEDLYLDTSFVRCRDVLEHASLEHPDRVLFGGSAPETHPNVDAMEILTLDMSEDTLTRAFSKGAARVVTALDPEEQ